MITQIPVRCPECNKRFKKSAQSIIEQKPITCPGCGQIYTPSLEEFAEYLTSTPLPDLKRPE